MFGGGGGGILKALKNTLGMKSIPFFLPVRRIIAAGPATNLLHFCFT